MRGREKSKLPAPLPIPRSPPPRCGLVVFPVFAFPILRSGSAFFSVSTAAATFQGLPCGPAACAKSKKAPPPYKKTKKQ